MKLPKTDTGKTSIPGLMKVIRVDGIPTVFADEDETAPAGENLLKVLLARNIAAISMACSLGVPADGL